MTSGAPAAEGGSGTYRYAVIELPKAARLERDEAWTAAINEMAAQGWRLHLVAPGAGMYASQVFAYFEQGG